MEQDDVTSNIIDNITKAEKFKADDVKFNRWEDVVGKYDNYSSEIKRLFLTVTESGSCLGSSVKSYIVKRITYEKLEPIQCIPLSECFNTEITVYNNVLKQMENVINSKQLDINIMWPKLITHIGNETLVLEDLKVCGYTMKGKRRGFPLQYVTLCLTSLAQVHGISAVLIHQGKLEFHMKDPTYARKLYYFKAYCTAGLKGLYTYLDCRCDPKWSGASRKVKKLVSTFLEDFNQLSLKTQGKYNVFNHGDIWLNNMLFQHESDIPVSLKFLDFQMSFVNSFCWDLVLYLFMNVPGEIRYSRMEEFLTHYQESFAETVSKLGPGFESLVPSRSDVQEGFDSLIMYAFFITCSQHVEMNENEEFPSEEESINEDSWFVRNHNGLMMHLEYFDSKGFFS